MPRSPFTTDAEKSIAARFGMWLFIAACATLFLASVVGYLVIRVRTEDWPTDLPALPGLLWISTVLLIVSSGTVQLADNACKRNHIKGVRIGLAATLVLGFAFLVLQTIAWVDWLDVVRDRWEFSESFRLALSGFYVFTSIHAAHLIGGLIPLAVITAWSFKGAKAEQSPAAPASTPPGIHGITLYWHFLDIVWILLFATLLIAM